MFDDQAAGTSGAGVGGSTIECMTFQQRPGTPPEIAKYRRSNNLQPGKRFVHPGIHDDLQTMNLGDKIHGVASDFVRETAHDLLSYSKATELEKMKLIKAEKVYKQRAREPLGTTYMRDGIRLPEKFTTGKESFGIKSVSSLEPAKEIIFPDIKEEDIKAEEIYIKSHNNWPVGAQRSRGIDWTKTSANPETTAFGRKGDTIAFNGVSANIAVVLNPAGNNPDSEGPLYYQKNIDNYASMSDQLGKSKNLGQQSGTKPVDFVYGRPSQTAMKAKLGPVWGAAQVMQGAYSIDEQKPDVDLGKSITPGFRNIARETRAYGCPSIRTDLPANPNPNTRSVADDQNYGDDVSAKDLISPPAYSDLNIAPETMVSSRSWVKVRDMFENIGYQFPDSIFEIIAKSASSGGELTIKDFRDCLNSYLSARDDGMGDAWLEANA